MITSAILLALVEFMKAFTQAATVITATQTPAQQAIFWQRWLDSTEWISKLFAKFSDQMEQLIDQETKLKPKL